MFFKLKHDPVELERFKADPYWHGFHQPANEHNLMRSVLTYNMQSKHDEPIQTLNYKYTKVLVSFYAENVVPDNVAQRLKDGGGIYFIYTQLCKSEKLRSERIATETQSNDVDATPAEILASDTSNGATDDEPPDANEEEMRAGSEDCGIMGTPIILNSNMVTDDQILPPVPAMRRAANAQTDEVKREISIAQPKQGPLNRVDLKKELIVEFLPEEIDKILASGGGEIAFSLMPCDERGYVRAIGRLRGFSIPRDDGGLSPLAMNRSSGALRRRSPVLTPAAGMGGHFS